MCPNGIEFKTLGEVTRTLPKGTLKTTDLTEDGYPVINSGKSLYGYYSNFNNECEAITIAARGEYAGWISYFNEKFWAGGLCYPYTSKDENIVKTKFIYYWLKKQECNIMDNLVARGSIPALNKSDLDKFPIPLPPIEIQKKIVECLDKFSALAAELQAELQLRRKQYEYYRTQLLTPHSDCNSADNTDDRNWECQRYTKGIAKVYDWQWKTLGEIAKYRRGSFPQPYGRLEWYDGEGAMPFVQVADVEEIGMCLKQETKQRISKLAMAKSVFVPKGTVIVTLQGSIGKVAVTQYDSYVDRTLGIFESYQTDINKKYFAYQLERVFSIKREKARGGTIKTITKEEFTDFSIPLPSLAEQERIVSILDKFEALTTSLSDGIPAEQAAQQKRYEYYRDKLLTFPVAEK